MMELICDICGNLKEDCECRDDELTDEPWSDDIRETDYDGDSI